MIFFPEFFSELHDTISQFLLLRIVRYILAVVRTYQSFFSSDFIFHNSEKKVKNFETNTHLRRKKQTKKSICNLQYWHYFSQLQAYILLFGLYNLQLQVYIMQFWEKRYSIIHMQVYVKKKKKMIGATYSTLGPYAWHILGAPAFISFS